MDIDDELWSAKILAEKPELIQKVHYDTLRQELIVLLQLAIRPQWKVL